MINHDAIDVVKKMCDDGLNKKLSQKQWAKEMDKRCMHIVAKKGELFFKSKIFKNEKGEPKTLTHISGHASIWITNGTRSINLFVKIKEGKRIINEFGMKVDKLNKATNCIKYIPK